MSNGSSLNVVDCFQVLKRISERGVQLGHDTMVARADAVVEHVRSGDTSLRLKAVREMKNQVVGSRSRKLQFLKAGAVPHLVAILATDGLDPSLIVQVPTCPHR